MKKSREQACLYEFVALVDELNSLRLAKNLLSLDSIVVQTQPDWADARIINFEEEEFRSFLLSCRLLIQDNDGISLRCVGDIVSNGPFSESDKKDIWAERFRLNLSLDDHCAWLAPSCGLITNRDVLKTFLWGLYAHRMMNPLLRERYLAWEAVPRQFYALKQTFLLMLKILLESATRIAQAIRENLAISKAEQEGGT